MALTVDKVLYVSPELVVVYFLDRLPFYVHSSGGNVFQSLHDLGL